MRVFDNPLQASTDVKRSFETVEVVRAHIAGALNDMMTGLVIVEGERKRRVLDDFEATLPTFIKIMPTDYKKALERLAREQEEAKRLAHEEALTLAEKQS